jgi:aminoglycoside phosphotransferase family enzyme
VYKVKKPVDLGFLDFTTPERRRFFCEEEVRLNRRLTHGVYLGVVELAGEVAAAMRRLPHERMLDRLVREGRADPPLLEEIGAIIARFHAAGHRRGDRRARRPRHGRRQPGGELRANGDLGEDVLPAAVRDVLRGWVEAYLDREAPRFAARVAAGRSRDCHGDLQTQHICCSEPIQIFDCIEFNHRFRYGSRVTARNTRRLRASRT